MNIPWDNMTEKEKRQFGARVNWVNSVAYKAQKRRKRIMSIKSQLEAGIKESQIKLNEKKT